MHEITLITQHFYPSQFASGQLMTDLTTGLSQRGYNVNVFTGSHSNGTTPEYLINVKINRAFSPIQPSRSFLSKIISSVFFIFGAFFYVIFKQHRNTTLLIASNPPYAGILGICFKILKGGNYDFLLQDIFPESAVMIGIMQPMGIVFRFFDRLIYLTCKYSRNTIVLTNSMKVFLENKYVSLNKKIKVIENWAIVDMPVYEKQDNEFAQQYNLTETFTILYSGNLGRLHDIETIAEAAKLLKDTPIKFVFIGQGAKINVLESAIETHQLKNILLLPYQPRELLPLSLTACDVSLVSLIAGAESIVAPSKLYGMLAAGRAIVALSSHNSYVAQLLVTYRCGINSPPGNPQNLANIFLELSTNSLLLKQMGERARQLYERKYTFKRALDEYEKLLFQN
ncbi:MAG: glycosyltransferase family 4 protein [Aulosira sp. DedQUE10]|nr:glycosyltransferase family 4 protein [Aulosira sp. DedQUE10]